jgi:hypothetical protein
MHKNGDKNVTIRTGGNEKQRCIRCDAVFYGGWQKVATIHCDTEKNATKSECKRCDIQAPESGWMDKNLVLDWIKHMWQSCPRAQLPNV